MCYRAWESRARAAETQAHTSRDRPVSRVLRCGQGPWVRPGAGRGFMLRCLGLRAASLGPREPSCSASFPAAPLARGRSLTGRGVPGGLIASLSEWRAGNPHILPTPTSLEDFICSSAVLRAWAAGQLGKSSLLPTGRPPVLPGGRRLEGGEPGLGSARGQLCSLRRNRGPGWTGLSPASSPRRPDTWPSTREVRPPSRCRFLGQSSFLPEAPARGLLAEH